MTRITIIMVCSFQFVLFKNGRYNFMCCKTYFYIFFYHIFLPSCYHNVTIICYHITYNVITILCKADISLWRTPEQGNEWFERYLKCEDEEHELCVGSTLCFWYMSKWMLHANLSMQPTSMSFKPYHERKNEKGNNKTFQANKSRETISFLQYLKF